MLETCYKIAMPECESKKLFALLINSLYAINLNIERADEVFAFFVIKLLDVLGIKPDMEYCCICGKQNSYEFDYSKLGVVCSECKSPSSGKYNDIISQIFSMKSKDIISKRINFSSNFTPFCVNVLESMLECKLKGSDIFLSCLKNR